MKANSQNRVSPRVETYDGSRPALLLISTGGLKEKRFSPERKMNKWRSVLRASKISRLRPESHGFSATQEGHTSFRRNHRHTAAAPVPGTGSR
jgi:hypothetical protein